MILRPAGAAGAVLLEGGLAAVLLAAAAEAAPERPRAPTAAADRADAAATLRGDGEAFARIVRRHQRAVAGRLWRFTRDRDTLEELVHRTFVEAWTSLRGWRDDAPFEHWLHRIAVRTGFRHWRERRLERERAARPLPAGAEIAAAAADPALAGALLHDLLERLSPRDRLVLTLLAIEGHSVAETAALTGWSRPLVKVQAHRARTRLRKLLAAGEEGGRP